MQFFASKRTLFSAVFAVLVLTAHASIMLGGAKDVAVDDHAKSVAAFAVQQLNAKNAFGSSGHELVRVTGYKTQVVAGTNHILTLQVSDAAGPKTVAATVWEKLPGAAGVNGDTMELTKYELAAQQSASEWLGAAQSALAAINSRSNALFPYTLADDAVASAAPANDGAHVQLVLRALQNGRPHEFDVKMERRADGAYHVVDFAQRAPAAAAATTS